MRITVLFFATLKDRAKTDRLELELSDEATVDELKAALAEQLPDLSPALPTALVSINHEFAFPTETVPAGAEVALFPPVSGGSNLHSQISEAATILRVTDAELDLNELVTSITVPETGAVCLFTGMVRGKTTRSGDGYEPHDTEYLEYEAYVPMAEEKMQQVADEIRMRWPVVVGIAIVQRVGTLHPGTPTVLIACSAGHRDTGVFEAARYGIDRLKGIVPVWKKEVGSGGESWVEGQYMPDETDRTHSPRDSHPTN